MDDIIKKLFFDVVVQTVLRAIITQIPFLGFPIIGPIFGLLLNWVAGKLYDQLSTVVAFTIIDIKTEEQQKAYDAAVVALKDQLAKPPEEQNVQDIEAAKEAFKKHLVDLIKFKSP